MRTFAWLLLLVVDREHEYCGELDTGLENDRVWVTCTCGAMIGQALEHARRQ